MIGLSEKPRRGLVAQTPCGHDWRYYEDPDHEYTGYLERCSKCRAITQVPR